MASRVMPPKVPDFQKALRFFQTLRDHAQTLRATAKEFERSYRALCDFLNTDSCARTIQ